MPLSPSFYLKALFGSHCFTFNMELPVLSIFTFLSLALVVLTEGAVFPPQLYWKSVLPTTPMPKAIKDLLHSDWMEDKRTYVDVGNGGVNVGAPGSGTNVNVGTGSPFNYNYAASQTQLHDDPNVALFFLEIELLPGTQKSLHFTKTSNPASLFLPRQISKTIPFSSDKLSETLVRFSIKPKSQEAKIMKKTIKECEEKGIRGEEKCCATSLESMVDFVTSKLGKNLQAISTEVKKETQSQKYTITVGVKKLGGEKSIVCHKQNYPYAVFYCHITGTTRAYSVPLEGADGMKVKAVAVCHTDTSEWNPKHLAFQVLKVKPGTVPICHFLPEDHVVWVPK